MAGYTLGVEEEFHLIGSDDGMPRPVIGKVLEHTGRDIDPEMLPTQIETATPVTDGLQELRAHLVRLRDEVDGAAQREGCRIVSSGSHPLAGTASDVTDRERYRDMAARFGRIAFEQVVCGCHVHVGLEDPDLAVRVMNRTRSWLSVILALAVNSPFWNGIDTGYASFRTQIWSRWPSAGPPERFADRADYDRRMQALIDVGVLRDSGMLYWDVRPSQQFDTLEFRMPDACLTVDDTVMIAGLVRALIHACVEEERRGAPEDAAPMELLRVAQWRAARSGCRGDLVDVVRRRAEPATVRIGALLDFLRPALLAAGDWDTVFRAVRRTLAEGTGAEQQRRFVAETGSLVGLMDFLVRQTVDTHRPTWPEA